MKTIYQTQATTTGAGRNGGHGVIGDNPLTVEFSPPGGSGHGNNPEQLVALGYSACFSSALNAVARKKGVTLVEPAVTVHANLVQPEEGRFALTFAVETRLKGVSQADAEALTQEAHQLCPYSRAFREGAAVMVSAHGDAG